MRQRGAGADGDRPEAVEFARTGAPELAADHLAALAAVATGADAGAVQLRDGRMLRMSGGYRLPSGWAEVADVPVESTIAAMVLATGRPVAVEDAAHDDRVPPDAPLRRVGWGAYAGSPVRDADDRLVGVCSLLHRHPRPWSGDDLAALDHAARACGALVAAQAARGAADLTRRFLDAVLESLRTPIAACDDTGHVVLVNSAMRAISPTAVEDFRANQPASAAGRFHPDGRPLAPDELPLARGLRGERVRDVEILLRRPGSRPRLVLVDGQPITDEAGRTFGAVVAFTDVTDRRRAERFRTCELRVATALADATGLDEGAGQVVAAVGDCLDWTHVELWLVDEIGGALRPAARWTSPGRGVDPRVPAELTLGSGLTGRVVEHGRPQWVTDVGQPGSLIPGDTARAAELRSALAVPLRSGQRTLGAMTLFSVEAEEPDDSLVRLLASIGTHLGQFVERRRAERLERQLVQSRDEYLALVGHELRTPLTSIGAYAALLRDAEPETFAADGPQLVRVIDRNAAVLREIVDELLDLAALDSGHAPVRAEPVDLAAVAREAVAAAAPEAGRAGLRLVADLPPHLAVTGDPERLRQVVDSVLANAVQHTPSGGEVALTLRDVDGRAAELTVTDTGIGVPPEERGSVFKRFYRSSRTRDRSIPGAGLSLALSRAILQYHGGLIDLAPGAERGTRVVVRLPLLRAAQAAPSR